VHKMTPTTTDGYHRLEAQKQMNIYVPTMFVHVRNAFVGHFLAAVHIICNFVSIIVFVHITAGFN